LGGIVTKAEKLAYFKDIKDRIFKCDGHKDGCLPHTTCHAKDNEFCSIDGYDVYAAEVEILYIELTEED
jgi:hypothetical protein